MQEQETHFEGKVAQKIVIVSGGKILISRDIEEELWDIPGGRLNVGEDTYKGLLREVKEELGIDIEDATPFHTDTFLLSRDNSPHVLICYHTTIPDPSVILPAQHEIAEVRWVDASDIASIPMWDEYKKALNKFFRITK